MILPKAPDTGTVASNVPPPLPDATAAKDLQEQQAAADQTEADQKRIGERSSRRQSVAALVRHAGQWDAVRACSGLTFTTADDRRTP
jgi:hypothetical protein